jgi:lipopolysaccharide/colanic/teichoic acid biosynthesis glycosyltransferase
MFYLKYGKCFLDLALTITALIVLSPVGVITALLIRMKLGSPIF